MSVLRAIAVFLCGFLSLRLTRAQIIMPGACPDIQPMNNFDPSRYLGRWYEAEKYFFVFEFGGKCITADYSLKDDGVVGVVNKQTSMMNFNTFTSLTRRARRLETRNCEVLPNPKSLSGITSEIRGQATQVSRSDEAKLSVVFPSLPYNIAAPYWVLKTDYETYSVVWSCYEFGPFHTVNAWILTRERNPPVAVLEKAYSILDKNHISRAYLMRTNQRDCQEPDD